MLTHLKTKHYAVLALFLGSLGTFLGTLTSYADIHTKPAALGGLIGVLAAFFSALAVSPPRRAYGARPGDVGYRKYAAVGLVLAGTMLAVGCGGPYHIATVSIVSSHESLKFAANTLEANVCGKPTAGPQCVAPERFKELATPIAHGFHIDGDVAKLVNDWDPSTPRPNFTPLLVDITAVIQSIVDALPANAKLKTVTVINGKK